MYFRFLVNIFSKLVLLEFLVLLLHYLQCIQQISFRVVFSKYFLYLD
jgi:hypothetical protein